MEFNGNRYFWFVQAYDVCQLYWDRLQDPRLSMTHLYNIYYCRFCSAYSIDLEIIENHIQSHYYDPLNYTVDVVHSYATSTPYGGLSAESSNDPFFDSDAEMTDVSFSTSENSL